MRKAIIIAVLGTGLALPGASALAHDDERYFAMGYLDGSTLGQHEHHRDASDHRLRDVRFHRYRPARIPLQRYRHWRGKQHRRAAYRHDHARHAHDRRYDDRYTQWCIVKQGHQSH